MATSSSSESTLVLTDADIAALQTSLAEQIGPAARIVIVRSLAGWDAAGQAPSAAYGTLLHTLASFIESEDKRKQFIHDAQNIRLGQ
ncbi:MAG: hypothetical protein ACPGPF_01890 [Pontibacterium sp.]